MHSHPKLLSTADEIHKLSEKLSVQEWIALDTEFIREHTFFPIVALIQVATHEESWLIDPLALRPDDLKPFFRVLTAPEVLKILHASQADQECLYTNYGVLAQPHFDTAVGASLAGYGDSAGLSRLLREILGVSIQKGHARTDWTVRPLQPQLLRYAHQDVHHLIPLARRLFTELDSRGRRDWAMELCARMEDPDAYEAHPEQTAQKFVRQLQRARALDRRVYATLIELINWREQRVRKVDVPRRRIADDDILLDLASVRPRDMEHLAAFRGLNKGELKQSGEAILGAIRRAAQIPEEELPPVPHVEQPTDQESRALELMQCFVRVLADGLQISARHLITSDNLLQLIRGRFSTAEDLVKAGVLTQGAAKLIGEDLVEMTQGRRGLSLKRGAVRIERLAES